MSAPTSSQRLATSLMKLILVARKAFEAYLIISSLARSVVTNGTATLGRGSHSVGKLCSTIGVYRVLRAARASHVSVPTTTRSGKRETWPALPSPKNSGLEQP